MDPEVLEALKIALSSAFIGFAIATTLYGITCLQVYLYYRNFPTDPISNKIIVFVLWSLDTLGSACIAHTLYYYLIGDLGKSDIDFIIPWSYAIQSETVDIITLITQSFFAWQIWKVGENSVVSLSIVMLAISAWALDIKVVVSMFRNNSGLVLADPIVLICGTTVQGLDALCDIIITTGFVYYLRNFKNGIRPTEKIIDNLILYAVSRGFLTVVAQIMFVSLEVAFPGRLYWLPFQQAVGKLYVNSLLASLNSRKAQHAPTVVNLTETVSRGTSSPWSHASGGLGQRPDKAHGRGNSNGTRSTGTAVPMSFSPNDALVNAGTDTFKTLTLTLGGMSVSEPTAVSESGSEIESYISQGTAGNAKDQYQQYNKC